MLEPVQSLVSDPVFTNNRDKLIPDPAVYDDWFSQANLASRKLAVGARRYSAATDVAGGHPEWAAFVEPETGNLLTLDQLRGESAAARYERMQKVRAEMAARRKDIGDVATWGFVPG